MSAQVSRSGQNSTKICLHGNNYNSANGHYYQVVSDEGIEYADAKTAAEASTYKGLSGYLVTITSEAENDFLDIKISQRGLENYVDFYRSVYKVGLGRNIIAVIKKA